MDMFAKPPAGKANPPQAVLARLEFNRSKDLLGSEPLNNMPELKEAISAVLPMMKAPSREVKVAIVDDKEKDILPLAAILNAWPGNMLVHAIVQRAENMIEVPADTEVLLLDHRMLGSVRGDTVAGNLRDGGFTGIIVSITGDATENPEYAQFRFLMKEMFRMGFPMDAAPEFVKVMNAVLEKLGAVQG